MLKQVNIKIAFLFYLFFLAVLVPELLHAQEKAENSEFEEFISGNSLNIRQFGYELFRQPPSTFAPADKVPVGPDYVIGPGDEMRLTLWGKIEGQWVLSVDRDGNIALPKVGIIGVTGLTFREIKDVIQRELSKYYTGFEMNLSMGQLRTIRVYVVGYAERPGAYTISSLSTLINALFEAGGPSKAGSMRDIQVKRNGKTVVHFDMYALLLNGDKTNDIRLMPEDVIYIPPAGPFVAISGSVKRPAIYELRQEKTINDLVRMAGGLSDLAFKGRVQVERIIDNSRQIVFESGLNSALNYELVSGDFIKIFQVFSDKRFVRIFGAIQRAGEYGFKDGITVKDLILMAGGLKYYAYLEEAEITRVIPTTEGPKTEKIIFSPQKAIEEDPEHNIRLQEDDYILIRAVPEWELYKTVTISGEVRFPGTYTIKKGERLSSLIKRAGGFTDMALIRGVEFRRPWVRELQQKMLDEMIDRLERDLLSGQSAQSAIATTPEESKIIQLETEQKRAFLARLRQAKASGRITLEIEPSGQIEGTPSDLELEDGDSIYVPKDPGTIQVVGSVYTQSAFIYKEGVGYNYYISLAGGYTENADKSNIYVLRADGTAQKAKYIDKIKSGDTIVVPEKLERIAWIRNIKDITQILYQIAVTAGVLIVAF